MDNKLYFDAGYLLEVGEEVHGKFGDIEGSIQPVNIVDVWIRDDYSNNSESTN